MPSGLTVEILVVVGLVALLVAVFVVTRTRRARPPRRARPAGPAARPPVRGEGLGGRVRALFARGAQPDTWRALEDVLLSADVGPTAARDLVARVRERYEPGADPAALVAREVSEVFAGDTRFGVPDGDPGVVMVVGVNGSGKTTTIGKLAALLKREGRKVYLANSDTFRAAAAEQLETWADRAGAELTAQRRGADPGAVAFDAVQAARSRGADVLIVDTAGRLHTRVPLMEELKKVRRVLEKASGRVDETLLVLDATTGQNGIAQARAFTEAVDVTGIALTKLDGTAKGGIVVAVRRELGIPVKLVGTGERLEDLQPFDPDAFSRALVGV